MSPVASTLAKTLGFASYGLIFLTGATLLIPLAYCKYGCPTGALFHFLRKTGASNRFLIRDLLAGAPCLAEGIFSG